MGRSDGGRETFLKTTIKVITTKVMKSTFQKCNDVKSLRSC